MSCRINIWRIKENYWQIKEKFGRIKVKICLQGMTWWRRAQFFLHSVLKLPKNFLMKYFHGSGGSNNTWHPFFGDGGGYSPLDPLHVHL